MPMPTLMLHNVSVTYLLDMSPALLPALGLPQCFLLLI